MGMDEDDADEGNFGFIDPDIDDTHTFTIESESGPSHGTLTLGANGAFGYVPFDNFFGTDTFVFRVTDGADAFGLGTVTIRVFQIDDLQSFDSTDGNDTITGTLANETIYGGPGDDILSGGGGTDVLWGGPGNDTLTGGSGGDMFIFKESGAADKDTILDFNMAEGDKIDIRDLLTGQSVTSANLQQFVRANYDAGIGGTIIAVDSTGSGTNFQEVVTLAGATIDGSLNLLGALLLDNNLVV